MPTSKKKPARSLSFPTLPNGADPHLPRSQSRRVREYAARAAVREAMADEDNTDKYRASIRNLSKYPITPPPKRVFSKSPRWLLLADAHFPFVDPATWQIAKWAARDLRPTGVIIMGDWNDFGSISTHEKSEDTADLTLLKEFAAGDTALDELDAVTPFAWFRKFLRGNHEWRVDRYLRSPNCDRALRDLIPSVASGLHLEERGYEYVEEKPDTFGTNHLFIHGHFFSKHHAAKHLETLWGNVVYGHTHMPQQFTHSTPLGAPVRQIGVATGLPTMRSLIRDWHEEKRVHSWVNGFGVMEFCDDKAFAHNIYVDDGKAAYGGFSWNAEDLLEDVSRKHNPRLQP